MFLGYGQTGYAAVEIIASGGCGNAGLASEPPGCFALPVNN